MQHIQTIFLIIILSLLSNFSFLTAKADKKEVLLVATYHFLGSSTDTYSTGKDDVLTEKRQAELAIFLKRLSQFQPTKIAIERRRSGSADENKKYQQYLEGSYQLNGNEREQVGYRLAQMMNHDTLYCIDEGNNWFMKEVAAFAEENGQGHILQEAHAMAGPWIEETKKLIRSQTILENFRHQNMTGHVDLNHSFYIDYLVRIGKDDSHIGADLVADWYKRNIKIFANVTRFAEPGDRILILYGQGHIHILKELFEDATDIEVIDVMPLLEETL